MVHGRAQTDEHVVRSTGAGFGVTQMSFTKVSSAADRSRCRGAHFRVARSHRGI
jgi:hypothetical protein